jgi:hypothetical protein
MAINRNNADHAFSLIEFSILEESNRYEGEICGTLRSRASELRKEEKFSMGTSFIYWCVGRAFCGWIKQTLQDATRCAQYDVRQTGGECEHERLAAVL